MRVRNKPWAKEKIANYPKLVIQSPVELKGKWKRQFNNNNPIHLEIGTGKGSFILEMARQNPSINFIGLERNESIIVNALDRLIETNINNLVLLNIDAKNLTEIFADGEISRIYLNFSDPWPKKRHEKRRLTYKAYLEIYKTLLTEAGEIHFKTDNQGLFEYSLESFSYYGMHLKNISLDLHNSNMKDNVMTEYEQKFSEMGNRIYRCEASF